MTDETSVSRRAYPTDLSNEQWALIEPLIPATKPGGRPRGVDFVRSAELDFVPQSDGLPVGDVASRLAAQEHGCSRMA